MKCTQARLVLSNLKRALIAEEKQGFTNSGVLGGFNAFLDGIVPRLGQLFPNHNLELLKNLAQRYSGLSPLQRREVFIELRRFMQEITDEAQEAFPLSEPSKQEEIPGKCEESKRDKIYKQKRTMPINVENQNQNDLEIEKLHINALAKPVLHTKSLQYLKGVGPERAKQLQKLGINNVQDLLLYYPRRYEDRRKRKITELKDGETATIAGKIVAGHITKGKLSVIKLTIEQEGRLLQATWFNQPFILKQYPIGTFVVVTGKVRWQQQVPEILATDIEKDNNFGTSTVGQSSQMIMPVYSETVRLSSKVIRKIIEGILEQTETVFPEFLPENESNQWMERSQAHREIHFPKNYASLSRARERLVWEEILFLQIAVAGLRQGMVRQESPSLTGGKELIERFYKSLPFRLTTAQQRVIQEIFRDMAKPQGMARLVQGDVGSGKTIVALAALLRAVGSGYQGAMMAPTEILALQHYQSLERVFASLGITVVRLSGSQAKSVREEALAMIRDGRAQVVVGTHALIQETVEFKALGLAVTDEQHRFGVRQRSLLQSKGKNPHVLVLTATPIPRTLALTFYGDLQLSVLDEMPAGRKPIVTRKLSERARPKMEKFLEEQIKLGRQIYVVCPLVEESETLDFISATQRADDLQKKFSNRRVALLHGKMKGTEKETIMEKFERGEIDILVATTVVEVGVNVPNASVMVIESADRFGLAQLHQLRGRVGRGNEQSYCFLLSGNRNSRRLEILCQTEDGFKIAEEDMRLRGIGELLGTRQHGLTELKLTDFSRDGYLVEKAYRMAQKVLQNPKKFKALFQEVQRMFPLDKIGVN